MDVNFILLLFSLIIIFGYISEIVFEKLNISDTLLLIIAGFIIGPNVLNYIRPESLGILATFFTTFTLLFLMFEGALKLDLRSFFRGFSSGVFIAIFYYFLSVAGITSIFLLFGTDLTISVMLGFSLGGVSTSFTLPILSKLNPGNEIRSVMTVEAALTDVLAIVFALAMIDLKLSGVFSFKDVIGSLISLFAVAGVVGIVAGALWIYFEERFIQDRDYMVTIGYLVLLYFLTEYLGGNGAIAALFFGMTLTNSVKLRLFVRKIIKGENLEKDDLKKIVSPREREFYGEISFFLKTFFFVYVGILLDLRQLKPVVIGAAISGVILLVRQSGHLFGFMKKNFKKKELFLINSLFARGIAPVAIVLTAIEKGVLKKLDLINSVYFVITATIIFSTVMIFFYKKIFCSQDEKKEVHSKK